MADIASPQTDLDFLTDLMRRKQRLTHALRLLDDAKDEVKAARSDVDKLLDALESHVMRRRDDLQMPKFPNLFGDSPPGADGGLPPAA